MRTYYVARHGEAPLLVTHDGEEARAAFDADADAEMVVLEDGQVVEKSEGATFLTIKRCFSEEQRRRAL